MPGKMTKATTLPPTPNTATGFFNAADREALTNKTEQAAARSARVPVIAANRAAANADINTDNTSEQLTGGDGKKMSPKSKAARGVPEHMVTTWVDFNQEPELHSIIERACKVRNVQVNDMLRNLLEAALEAQKPAIEADAAKAPETKKAASFDDRIAKMTPAQIQAERLKLEAQIAKMQALLGKGAEANA